MTKPRKKSSGDKQTENLSVQQPPQTAQLSIQLVQLQPNAELDRLSQENRQLKEQIINLENKFGAKSIAFEREQAQRMLLEQLNNDKDNEIKKLRIENEVLKKLVEELTAKVDKLERENEELKSSVNKLTVQLGTVTNDRIKDKLILAIQGANGSFTLEPKISGSYRKFLKQLRDERNGIAHYIYNSDSGGRVDPDELKNYKLKLLVEKLNDATLSEVFNEIDYQFQTHGFVDEIKSVVAKEIKTLPEPSEIDKRYALKYWM